MAVEDSEPNGIVSGLKNIRIRDWLGLFIISVLVAIFTAMNVYMFLGILTVVFAAGAGYLSHRRA